MKLPIAFLLYLVSLGLLGVAGWVFTGMLPHLPREFRTAKSREGVEKGQEHLTRGKGQGPVSADWKYDQRAWWQQLLEANFRGTLPKTDTPVEGPKPDEPPPIDQRPLDQIIELVSVVYDSSDGGKGATSHVIVRYKPEANAKPPDWWVRENQSTPASAAAPSPSPRDVIPPRPGQPAPRAGGGPQRPPTPLPTSNVGRDLLQRLWVTSDGDPRRETNLWPPFADVKLVGIAENAQSAFFVRTPPQAPPPNEGETAPAPVEPKTEQLFKMAFALPQELLAEVDKLRGIRRDPSERAQQSGPRTTAPSGAWVESETTRDIDGVKHIGRDDERRFRENPDEILNQFDADTYVSPYSESKTRGVRVLAVDPQLSSRFGVQRSDVLLSINGTAVTTKMEAYSVGKKQYQAGVRTFVTKWLSNGREIERTIQAPDR